MEIGYKNVMGLKTLKALNTPQESTPDYTREEIEENLEALNSKLGAPISNKDASLYDALKKGIEKMDISKHNWRNPLLSTAISDESQLVKNLKQRQRRTFLVIII